jgi:hypothetical protein
MGKNIKAEVSNKIKQDVKKMSKWLASKTFQIKKRHPSPGLGFWTALCDSLRSNNPLILLIHTHSVSLRHSKFSQEWLSMYFLAHVAEHATAFRYRHDFSLFELV